MLSRLIASLSREDTSLEDIDDVGDACSVDLHERALSWRGLAEAESAPLADVAAAEIGRSDLAAG